MIGILIQTCKNKKSMTNDIEWKYANGFELKSKLIIELIDFIESENIESFQIFKDKQKSKIE